MPSSEVGLPPFELVVTEHGPRVLAICRSRLDPADVDDAWSETFLAALSAWPDLPPDLDAAAWLATVARRKCTDVHRARARRRADPVAELPDVPGEDDPHDDEGVWRHVAELPTKQRQVITYRYLGGLSHARVAELVGGTEAAARRAASDGLKTLREKEIR
ncbi:RNA polymerase sigma factor [Janibacter cremeus]|uniref:RNA polymerase sigma factor (Sigma-70 family) n=1 Tax=Janibacter cremeus TaxID=1285192 RepID=A0A852VP70_9MICO|nr:sigma-70 family RNA polymerase sigma factor [Janibacter cremeus]NYF97719.1 RNA polymerase sigma factor (sigma-70 family) [Janibacter cremeus]